MRLWFSWVGHKKDGKGKSHLWGILNKEEGNINTKYICWGAAKSRAYLRKDVTFLDAAEKRNKKIREGYKQINQVNIEKYWPDFMADVEMQFMLDKLIQ